jgi:hypothetical protein
MRTLAWVAKTHHVFLFMTLLVFSRPLSALENAIGVHDQDLNDTQFFTLIPETSSVVKLGESHDDYDIEALDLDPISGQIYAASGDDTSQPGHLYRVDESDGALTTLGPLGFREVDGLAFRADGTLWGWAQDAGLFTVERSFGNTPDLNNVKVIIPYTAETEVEDLTWNKAGTVLYAVQNMHDDSVNPDRERDPGQNGVNVWAYYPETDTIALKCEFTQSPEIETLETLPDDTLLFGYHGKNTLTFGQLDVNACQVSLAETIATPYADMEGLIWPNETPPICSLPSYSPSFWNDDWVVLFMNNCYNYGNNKRTDTFAQPGRAAGITLSWPEDMNCEAVKDAAIADGITALPFSGHCPDAEDKVALVVAPAWDYHWYRLDDNGKWSHKPGGTPATNLDNKGNPIDSPETADRGIYSEFCGYFCACSDAEQGQGHENIW